MENESYNKALITLNNIFLINKIVRFFALTAFKIMLECRKKNAKAKRYI